MLNTFLLSVITTGTDNACSHPGDVEYISFKCTYNRCLLAHPHLWDVEYVSFKRIYNYGHVCPQSIKDVEYVSFKCTYNCQSNLKDYSADVE